MRERVAEGEEGCLPSQMPRPVAQRAFIKTCQSAGVVHLREEAEGLGWGGWRSLSGHPKDCLTGRKDADIMCRWVCLLGASVQNRVQRLLWGEAWRLQEAKRGQKPACMLDLRPTSGWSWCSVKGVCRRR